MDLDLRPQEDGSYKTIPQLGNVIIEDNVAIGANTVIDCATLFGDATVIRQGVKLDNLIQIAHNVEIGQEYSDRSAIRYFRLNQDRRKLHVRRTSGYRRSYYHCQ